MKYNIKICTYVVFFNNPLTHKIFRKLKKSKTFQFKNFDQECYIVYLICILKIHVGTYYFLIVPSREGS